MTQLNTTLDVDCYRWMDWFHGGLQFQVGEAAKIVSLSFTERDQLCLGLLSQEGRTIGSFNCSLLFCFRICFFVFCNMFPRSFIVHPLC